MNATKSFDISKHTVMEAFKLIKQNAGSAGVDAQSIQDFEINLKDNLYKIWNRMSAGSYIPPAVKSVPIPKKSGGTRILGIPTVSDRIAQMVVKMALEPKIEPYFHRDSYGYRPNKSAHQAIAITRKRCWKFDWVLEFDIKGLFDNINHELLLKAVAKHTDCKWIILYITRWLKAPLQNADGTLLARDKGTPQGGVISPILSNLFLHYVFDKWMQINYPNMQWCRYCDDGLIHCKTINDAKEFKSKLEQRFRACELELHPTKTKIIYCKDADRNGDYKVTKFDFLGYTFRPRSSKNKYTGKVFANFTPAISKDALNSIRREIRNWNITRRVDKQIEDLSRIINPIIRGWQNYYGKFYPSELNKLHRYIDSRILIWVRNKYKDLRGHKTKSAKWLVNVAKQRPELFAHWSG